MGEGGRGEGEEGREGEGGLFALSTASCLPFVSAKNISKHEASSSLLIYGGQNWINNLDK